jgi:hypothetical protein
MSPDQLLIAQICFEEALDRAADRVSVNAPIAAPGLATSNEAVEKRMREWGEGGRVNLPAIAKRVVKQEFPELTFDRNDGDCTWFTKPIGPRYSLQLGIARAFHAIGKGFTLKIQLWCNEAPPPRNRWTDSLFRVVGWEPESAWTYSGKDVAEGVVREAVHLAHSVWGQVETEISVLFAAWPLGLPEGVEIRGQPTAREALPAAEKLVSTRWQDATLFQVSTAVRSLAYRDASGPHLTWHGRLTLNSEWRFWYFSPSNGGACCISVPEAGRIRWIDQTGHYQDVNSRRHKVPIGVDWIDSSRAFAAAGGYPRNEGVTPEKTWELFCRLDGSRTPSFLGEWIETPDGNPLWQVEFFGNDCNLAIDACTARIVHVGKR